MRGATGCARSATRTYDFALGRRTIALSAFLSDSRLRMAPVGTSGVRGARSCAVWGAAGLAWLARSGLKTMNTKVDWL